MAGLMKSGAVHVRPHDFIDVRLEAWYPQYLSSICDAINSAATKKKFVKAIADKNGGLRVFGVEGDIVFGVRTKYEWIALQEDCEAAFKMGRLKYRPTFVRVKFEDLVDDLEWLDKSGKVRYGVMASCPSQIGDDVRIMDKVRDICAEYDNISVNFSSGDNVVNGLFQVAHGGGGAAEEPAPAARVSPVVSPAVEAIALEHSAPLKVTLAGREGLQEGLMGPYELSAEPAHGYPRYSKRAAGGKTHWLYRSSGTGKWVATDDEGRIAFNAGGIRSARAAALPTEAGLAWTYHDGKALHDDPKMTCTEG
eukprot:CAMPEP_0119480912 /NCGR_PEP_ID=MMETSP1344-20130328/9508_1 /TAXON_ID=236787 /ORGANISM="Florenciella parvula, Strain CCMP2471" /LENGTH=307 /DNA_ID=CAMNT_0007515267 /DNA_START=84 /DNA_END=1007 /DNA_ORIENTATION=-